MLKKILPSKKENDAIERRGTIYTLYKLLNVALPIGLLLLIRNGLVPLAILVALFSKWRVFAVKPRHLAANLRSNAVDIVVKLSTLAFMVEAATLDEQILWTMWYIIWLVVIKPASSKYWMVAQALIAQVIGISAIYLFSTSDRVSDLIILFVVWVVSLSSARHFLSAYEETKTQLMAHMWAAFVLQLAWVLHSWILVYVFVPQVVFIIVVIGYALGSVYDAYKEESLKPAFIRQQVTMSAIILVLIILFADWRGGA